MLYKITNPSDPYIIDCPDLEIAAVACIMLGRGQYQFEPLEGNTLPEVPFFIFGSADQWFNEHLFMTAQAALTHCAIDRMEELIAAFESVLIGDDVEERKEFLLSTQNMTTEQFNDARQKRHNERRSSMNDIGGRAYEIARRLRLKPDTPLPVVPQQVFRGLTMYRSITLLIEGDRRLLALHRRVAHSIQRWTGITSFRLTAWGLRVWGLQLTAAVFNYYWPILKYHKADSTDIYIFPFVLGMFFMAERLIVADRKILAGYAALPTIVRFCREVAHIGSRVMQVVLSVMLLIGLLHQKRYDDWFGLALIISVPVTYYTVHVDPLVGCRGKIREWLNVWIGAPNEA